ncbi:MAG: trypsin-like serine protease [Burkholderiaceae bacterium]
MRKFSNIFCILCMALLASCGSDGDSDNTGTCSALGLTDSTATAKIANGTPCAGLNKSPIVVVLKNMPDGKTGACTGTMLSPNKVLTAAHCLEGAGSIDILFGVTTDKFAYVTSSSWNIHPSFVRNPNGTLVNDVGIVHTAVSLPVPNLPILTSTAPKIGTKASIFGYGVAVGGAEIDGKLRAGAMTVAGVDTDNIYANYEASSSNVCSGDSGGPLLLQVGGQQVIAGTTSYGNTANCSVGETSVFMNLQSPSIQSFIRSIAPDARFN